jgi:hypothetical protein
MYYNLQCDNAFLNCRKIRQLMFDKCKYNDRGSILQFRLVYVAHDISRTVVVAHYKYFLLLNTKRKTFLAYGILTSSLCDNMAIYELISQKPVILYFHARSTNGGF